MDSIDLLEAEIVRLRRKLETEARAARTDPLTGLGNRRGFDELVAELRERGESFALLAFDAANLKAANTLLGHVGADQLLVQIAKHIRQHIDIAFRTGGDEFVVVLRGIRNVFRASLVRRRIERAVGRIQLKDGVSFFLAGGEAIVGPDETVANAMLRADRAAERHKELLKRARGECTTR